MITGRALHAAFLEPFPPRDETSSPREQNRIDESCEITKSVPHLCCVGHGFYAQDRSR